MFIETALKNIALNTIMAEIDSSSVYDMYDKAISSYKNAPAGTREDIKKKYQNNKLNLQGSIQNAIAAAYRKENKSPIFIIMSTIMRFQFGQFSIPWYSYIHISITGVHGFTGMTVSAVVCFFVTIIILGIS